jgi:CheY-like chemotaxis protein
LSEGPTYDVKCLACGQPFDAIAAAWCGCLVSERSVACPACGACFCKAPAASRQRFWREAPAAMWDRKLAARDEDEGTPPNPDPADVVRPLVLVVDDDKDIRRSAALAIRGLGYGLVVARDGAEGLELARLYRPDVVLTDALMPKMDGRELARQIKEEPDLAAVRVVVMTSLYTSKKYEIDAHKNYRVDAYVTKPLELPRLTAVLREQIAQGAAPA